MAVHPLVPGIDVAVCVNREPLPEYDDDESRPDSIPTANGHEIRTITKYIESTADQEFSFRFTVSHPYQLDCASLHFQIKIDGKRMKGKTFRASKHGLRRPWSRYVDGIKREDRRTGKLVLLPYTFTAIETSLNDDALETIEGDMQKMKETGQIIVEVFRETKSKLIEASWSKTRGHDDAPLKVHEKALKGEPKYHGFQLGTARQLDRQRDTEYAMYESGRRLDGDDCPIIRFAFKYRSNEGLRQLLILDRTLEPNEQMSPEHVQPLGIERLDDEQRQQVESFVRNLTQSGSSSQDTKVKRERGDDGDRAQHKKRPRKSEEIELIDLTED
ncbi:hypothetical protein EG329_000229 [Mollisiaceae sp. DMI_Dod_QoI]|nr:hypothetical protein EG329_000229 [Helotiales sp. DMI_Dod_QoI]